MTEKSIKEKLDELNQLIDKYDFRKSTISCFVPDCKNAPIASHTIQRKNILAYLEDKTEKNYDKVYSLEDQPSVNFGEQKLASFHRHRRKLVELGKSEASTVSGFCPDHDKSIFKSIEDESYDDTSSKNFLHSLRAYVYDICCTIGVYNISIDFLKQVGKADESIQQLKDNLPQIEKICEMIPDDQVFSENDIQALRSKQNNSILKVFNMTSDFDKLDFTNKTGKYLKDYFKISVENSKSFPRLNPVFAQLDVIIKNRISSLDKVSNYLVKKYYEANYNCLNYSSFRIEGLFPIAGCFVANLVNTNSLNSNEQFVYQPLYSLTVFPDLDKKETRVIFSSMEFNHSKLFYSRVNILSDQERKIFLTNLILSKGTNCFISPRLWNKLSINERELLIKDKSNSDPMFIDTAFKVLNLFEERFRE